jgi:hypothetical protein
MEPFFARMEPILGGEIGSIWPFFGDFGYKML